MNARLISPRRERKLLALAFRHCLHSIFFSPSSANLPAIGLADAMKCIEQNPIGAWLLQIHPAVFLVSAIAYAILFTWAILLLPRSLAWWISVGLLLAHAHGVKTWLWQLAPQFRFWEVVVNTLAAGWAAFCYLHAQATDPKIQPPKAP